MCKKCGIKHKNIIATDDNFDEIINNVKFAGKAVAAAGVVLEAVEYGDTVYRDLNDADGKLGKETLKASVGIVGEWAGGLTGAKLGAMGEAAFGSAILLGAGTAVGGFVYVRCPLHITAKTFCKLFYRFKIKYRVRTVKKYIFNHFLLLFYYFFYFCFR